MGCEIVKIYKDHRISGAKGRDKRPAFDALCRAATRRDFDMVMAWSVDRLGRSLQDLVGFLPELHALKIDLGCRCATIPHLGELTFHSNGPTLAGKPGEHGGTSCACSAHRNRSDLPQPP
jgi:hypothetical protein